uniref:Uncharacterized protein n=1 Tax=Anopheles culicifacies TaxID=139723 RepID=A0A182LYQ4_9DIPT
MSGVVEELEEEEIVQQFDGSTVVTVTTARGSSSRNAHHSGGISFVTTELPLSNRRRIVRRTLGSVLQDDVVISEAGDGTIVEMPIPAGSSGRNKPRHDGVTDTERTGGTASAEEANAAGTIEGSTDGGGGGGGGDHAGLPSSYKHFFIL